MERVDILRKLVEYHDAGKNQLIVDVLAGMSHQELVDLADIFQQLANFAKDAPRYRDTILDDATDLMAANKDIE